MEKRRGLQDIWTLHRLQAGGAAALLTGTAMAVPVGILLIGFSMNGRFMTAVSRPITFLVCTLAFTLLFPLVAVTFRAIRKVERSVAEIMDTIKFDGLTRVLSRSYFFELMRRANENGYVFLIDADYFKSINDTYGHSAGDAALVELANSIGVVVGTLGHVGRVGGEEFGVFLPGVSRCAAQRLAEDIRARVESHPAFVDGKRVSLTVSIGAAPYLVAEPARTAMASADKNLFRAKEWGRNMVVFDVELSEQHFPRQKCGVMH